jgi:hypothetical protein
VYPNTQKTERFFESAHPRSDLAILPLTSAVFALGKYLQYPAIMKPQQLPIKGEALAYATKEYVDEAYDRLREALEWTHLPRAILAIWEHSPMLKAERKNFPSPIGEIRGISRIIVTFPGSTAVERIADLLITSKIVPNSEGQYERAREIASEIFTLTMRYTRVQNLLRHIRSAVNSHLRMLNIESSRDRSGQRSSYENFYPVVMQNPRTMDRIAMLRSAELVTQLDVNDWADDLNEILATYSNSGSDGAVDSATATRSSRPRGAVAPGALNSYKIRFKQALAGTLGINLADKNVRIEKTSNKSIEDLVRELDKLPDEFVELNQMLENLRPMRISRPDASRNEFVYEFKSMGNENTKKNLLRHVLSLSGRELIIEGSRGAFTSDMVTGVLKTVSLQLSIDPDAAELRAAFESRGQILRVQIEQPKKSDHRKLTEIFLQLV